MESLESHWAPRRQQRAGLSFLDLELNGVLHTGHLIVQ